MKRGGYGKPYRPPADGWFVPRRVYFGGLYQNLRSGLNGLPKFVNTTQITLQPNQVGQPMTRPAFAISTTNCEDFWSNGLPYGPWLGNCPASQYYLPAVLGGSLNNTFTQQGTNDRGNQARLRGFKHVQAVRQWHGTFGWLSHDPTGCADVFCPVATTDCNGVAPGGAGYIATYYYPTYESPQPTADQTKYLSLGVSATYSLEWHYPVYRQHVTRSGGASGSRTVNPQSGEITSNVSTNWHSYEELLGPSSAYVGPVEKIDIVNGVKTDQTWAEDGSGTSTTKTTPKQSTPFDGICFQDFHCASSGGLPASIWWADGVKVIDLIPNWNILKGSCPVGLPPVTSLTGYDASDSFTNSDGVTYAIHLYFSRTNTVYHWGATFSVSGAGAAQTCTYSFDATATLSTPNTSASVYADIQDLLGCWDLSDDAQYPPRTDGVWGMAPLVSRDEVTGDVSPLGWNTNTVDDLRSPCADANGNGPWSTPQNPPPLGWYYSPNNNDSSGLPPSDPAYGGAAPWNPTYNPTPWFDANAWCFIFPAGRSQNSAAATGLIRYALTGLILGMPMPDAFADNQSYWYQDGFSVPSDNCDFENFFDFRAEIYRACQWYTEDGSGPFVDDYLWGHGQWLYDAIDETGAMLPHCATQWSNYYDAMTKPPYAWLIQSDSQIYDQNGAPGPSTDFHPHRPDALWAQKCCEIQEIWPSQDFFRPAGADRFAPDETAVYCISAWDGTNTIAYLASDPANISAGDFVGVSNGGNAGIYSVAYVDHGALAITLGTFHYPLPTGFALPSGDTGTAIWKVRFPNAPAILGRDAVATLTDAGGGNTTITLTVAEPNLMTGDTIDLCSTAFTYDSNGNQISEAMTAVRSNIAVTRVDDTHFTVAVAIGSLTGVAYIVSHGAPNWYWDDNGRKGDFSTYTWLYDYRTNAEVSRLSGLTDCSGNMPPSGSPAANNGFASFSQTAGAGPGAVALPFKPCCCSVIAITPNGETWPNGSVVPFPATFNFDDRYGARWQGEIEQAMVDLLWQAPHEPCGMTSPDTWQMDDGTCKLDALNGSGGTDHFYAHFPFVESRINLPSNGGLGQNETAPALPAGVAIGHGSPVTYPALTNALYPPGTIGFDPGTGLPSSAWTIWGYRLTIENHACFGSCRFDYVGMENLACVVSYAPAAAPAPVDGNTGSGSTGDGLT